MRWEWDEDKRLTNIRKRGIDFADVPAMFEGPMWVRVDDREDFGEERFIAMGFLGRVVAVVVYTERRGEVIRIISARKANRYERKEFEKAVPNGLGSSGESRR